MGTKCIGLCIVIISFLVSKCHKCYTSCLTVIIFKSSPAFYHCVSGYKFCLLFPPPPQSHLNIYKCASVVILKMSFPCTGPKNAQKIVDWFTEHIKKIRLKPGDYWRLHFDCCRLNWKKYIVPPPPPKKKKTNRLKTKEINCLIGKKIPSILLLLLL